MGLSTRTDGLLTCRGFPVYTHEESGRLRLEKLKRLISFLHQKINGVRIIGADDLLKMQTFIDSSHAVHEDMKGHTGGMITFGTGVVSVKSSKQKMNSQSSN